MRQRRRGRPLAWLLIAEAISLTGSRVSFLAVPWLVLVTTGSAARTGLATFAEMLPYVVASAFGGPIIDRQGPQRMSVRADIASVVAMSIVPLLYRADRLPFAALLSVIAAAGALRGFGDIAKQAMFPRAVEVSGVDMTRATSLHDGINRLSFLLGGAVGGVLIAWLGAANALLVDGASFALAAIIIAGAVRVAPVRHRAHGQEPYGAALRAGLRHVRGDRLIFGVVLVVLATNLLDQAYVGVFIPVWVHDVVDSPEALGLLFGAFGLGAVIGNVLFTAFAPKLSRLATFKVGFVLSGAPQLLVMAVTHSVAAVAITLLASGVLCAPNNPILSAVVYERVPHHLQARVIGLLRATAWAGIPLGGVLGGLAVERLGLTTALVCVGAIYLLVTSVPFVVPVWRDMNAKPVHASAA